MKRSDDDRHESDSPPCADGRWHMGGAVLLATGTLLSRLLGFARDMLFAFLLGPGADVFLLAFRLPNFMRRLLAEGSLGLAYAAGAGVAAPCQTREGARRLAWQSAFTLFVFSLPVTIVLALLAFPLAFCMAPGLDEISLDRSAFLLRLCLPYIPLCLFSAVAFSHASLEGNFRPQAWSPAIWNGVILISGGAAMLLAPVYEYQGLPEYLLCAGVSLGGLVQALLALGCIVPGSVAVQGASGCWAGVVRSFSRKKARPVDVREKLSSRNETANSSCTIVPEAARRFLLRFTRALAGAAPHQLHIIAGTVIASFLFPGAISALYFAERLVEFPLGLAGASVGMASLPIMVSLAAKRDTEGLSRILRRNILRTAFLSLPAAAGLFALSGPLACSFFGHGAATPETVAATAAAMQGYAFAIPALCASRPILAALHALSAGEAALRFALRSLVPVLLVSLAGQFVSGNKEDAFSEPLLFVSLGISSGAWCNMLLLLSHLKKVGAKVDWSTGEKRALFAYLAAAFALGLTLSLVCLVCGPPGTGGLLLLVAGSILFWFAFFRQMGSMEAKDFFGFFKNEKK